MRALRFAIGTALVCAIAAVGAADESPEAPQPTAEHEALGGFVGSWTGSGEVKPGPLGPGGPVTWTEECSWFEGAGFHVLCTSEGSMPMGEIKGLGIMGFDPVKKVYTHFGIDSTGWTSYSEGTRTGDRWTFSSEETLEGKTFHSRFSMTMESPTRMAFSWEMSEDGTTWAPMMTGTTVKR